MTEARERLKLLEKEPGLGKITVLIGPDGGGKSFLAEQLLKAGGENMVLIKGTKPEEWPIAPEEKAKLVKLRERYKEDDFKLYGLLSLALHRTVLELARKGKNVVVDSEPTFKWLMWEEDKGKLTEAVKTLTDNKLKVVMPDLIKYVVPPAENREKQAELIWDRLKDRIEKSEDDPKNLEEVKARLKASEKVIVAMEKLGVKVEGKPRWV